MVFIRKIKSILSQPCLGTSIDIDSQRRYICLVDISTSVYILSTQSLNNCIESWRASFERDLNYSSLGSLDNIIYKFNSFEVHSPISSKFSGGILNEHQSQPESVLAQEPKSYTAISETSNKKIKISVLYSAEASSFYSEKKEKKQSRENEQYLLAILESGGNIKIFNPEENLSKWCLLCNIVYKNNQFSTLDYAWSIHSKFLFVAYSDTSLIQYDCQNQYTLIRRFEIKMNSFCKIVTNTVNDCLIIKNETIVCQLIDFKSTQAFTFTVFKEQPAKKKEIIQQVRPRINNEQEESQLIDKDFQEEFLQCFEGGQSTSASFNGQFACLGSLKGNSCLLFSVNQSEVGFQWKFGFKKIELDIKDTISCSSFSDFEYILLNEEQFQLQTTIQLNKTLDILEGNIKQKKNKEQPHQILAIGSERRLILYQIVPSPTENMKPQINRLLVLEDLKCEISQILWINAYTLLLLMSDYSLLYFSMSACEIGFSLKQEKKQKKYDDSFDDLFEQ